MKMLLLASLLLAGAPNAIADQPDILKRVADQAGYYDFTFIPDDKTSPFTLCIYFNSVGGGNEFEDLGNVVGADATGPFGVPDGNYTVTVARNFSGLSLTVVAYSNSPPPNYGYFLTGTFPDGPYGSLAKIFDTHFTIGLAVEQPPPQRVKNGSGRIGEYSIVKTGTFTVLSFGPNHC